MSSTPCGSPGTRAPAIVASGGIVALGMLCLLRGPEFHRRHRSGRRARYRRHAAGDADPAAGRADGVGPPGGSGRAGRRTAQARRAGRCVVTGRHADRRDRRPRRRYLALLLVGILGVVRLDTKAWLSDCPSRTGRTSTRWTAAGADRARPPGGTRGAGQRGRRRGRIAVVARCPPSRGRHRATHSVDAERLAHSPSVSPRPVRPGGAGPGRGGARRARSRGRTRWSAALPRSTSTPRAPPTAQLVIIPLVLLVVLVVLVLRCGRWPRR